MPQVYQSTQPVRRGSEERGNAESRQSYPSSFVREETGVSSIAGKLLSTLSMKQLFAVICATPPLMAPLL